MDTNKSGEIIFKEWKETTFHNWHKTCDDENDNG